MFVSFDPPSAWMLKISCSWRKTGNTEHTWHTGEVATPPVLLVTPVQSSRWLSASWETQTLRRSCSQVENSTPVHRACVCVCDGCCLLFLSQSVCVSEFSSDSVECSRTGSPLQFYLQDPRWRHQTSEFCFYFCARTKFVFRLKRRAAAVQVFFSYKVIYYIREYSAERSTLKFSEITNIEIKTSLNPPNLILRINIHIINTWTYRN